MLRTFKRFVSVISDFIFLLTYSWFASQEVEEDEHFLPFLKLGYWEGVEPLMSAFGGEFMDIDCGNGITYSSGSAIIITAEPREEELVDMVDQTPLWEAEAVIFGDREAFYPEEYDAVELAEEARQLFEGDELKKALDDIIYALADIYYKWQEESEVYIPF